MCMGRAPIFKLREFNLQAPAVLGNHLPVSATPPAAPKNSLFPMQNSLHRQPKFPVPLW